MEKQIFGGVNLKITNLKKIKKLCDTVSALIEKGDNFNLLYYLRKLRQVVNSTSSQFRQLTDEELKNLDL